MKVTERALIARINRKLSHGGEKFCIARKGTQLHWNLGRYYVLDFYRNTVVNSHLDLESYGREIGALSELESLT